MARSRSSWRRASRAAGFVVAAVVAGCGGDGGSSPETTPAPAATPSPAATAAAAATPTPVPGRKVRFRATDGRRVEAKFTPAGRHAPAVVLLHQIDGGVDQFDAFVPALHAAGFATLAYRSRPDISETDRLPDLAGALRWMRAQRGVDRSRIGLVGASIGASTAAVAIADTQRRSLRAAVALSPPDSPDVFALQDAGRYRPHDVLFVSDAHEASAVENAMPGAVRSKAVVAPDAGHGVQLLPLPAVRRQVIGWLRDRL
jgi:dienelactone hydrolase